MKNSFACLLLFTLFTWSSPAAAADEIIVSAASSLTNSMQEIGKGFEKMHPGTRVIFNFAATGSLLQQIRNGAPVDVFAAANEKYMDAAEQGGLIRSASRRNFARNSLVLAVPSGATLPVTSLADLSKSEVQRIAVGNPDMVPAGQYTRDALQRNDAWESLQPKLIYAGSVRQVLDYLVRGEVDAGFVYATDAALVKDRVRVVSQISSPQPIVYPAAVTQNTINPGAATDFMVFLLSAEGQKILAGFGFLPPDGANGL